jgi:hypothetical protein
MTPQDAVAQVQLGRRRKPDLRKGVDAGLSPPR